MEHIPLEAKSNSSHPFTSPFTTSLLQADLQKPRTTCMVPVACLFFGFTLESHTAYLLAAAEELFGIWTYTSNKSLRNGQVDLK